jgi:hypothetical protein
MYKMTTALALGLALTGCASMKPSVHTESTFVIYDVKPATLDRNQFLKAVLDAVQTSASKLRVNREIPPRSCRPRRGALSSRIRLRIRRWGRCWRPRPRTSASRSARTR